MHNIFKLIFIGIFIFGLSGTAMAATNLALGLGYGGVATATQSSTGWGGTPEKAIDGITDGNWLAGQISHTDSELNAWWQVDLKHTYNISQIILWNRTDCCSERLTNFMLYVLDEDKDVVWSESFFTTGEYPNPSFSVNLPAGKAGEFVKVQLNGTNYLQLAEVQVYGTSQVPLPGAFFLFAPALFGLTAIRKRLKK